MNSIQTKALKMPVASVDSLTILLTFSQETIYG
jgi:hypothetical protein